MNLLLLLAAILTFTDSSGTETGFLVQIVKADGTTRYETFPANAGTGVVTLNLPNDGPGDCFLVAAFNLAGTSTWTNRACLAVPAGALPNAPNTAAVK